MDRFARLVIGYHGCDRSFADRVLATGDTATWRPSEKAYDWLGRGIYFWEHAPTRALRWAREKGHGSPDVIGAVIQLGRCFDLMDEHFVAELARTYEIEKATFEDLGKPMPANKPLPQAPDQDVDLKNRRLDCHVLNACLNPQSPAYETVRGAFWEGPPAFEGSTIRRESHIQIAVREPRCILGVFRPTGLM